MGVRLPWSRAAPGHPCTMAAFLPSPRMMLSSNLDLPAEAVNKLGCFLSDKLLSMNFRNCFLSLNARQGRKPDTGMGRRERSRESPLFSTPRLSPCCHPVAALDTLGIEDWPWGSALKDLSSLWRNRPVQLAVRIGQQSSFQARITRKLVSPGRMQGVYRGSFSVLILSGFIFCFVFPWLRNLGSSYFSF